MSREKTLVKNTIILTIGKICTQMITFFLLPLYTRILSTEEYGIVDLLNTLVSLLLPIITLQSEQAIFRYLIDERDNENNKQKIISTGIISITVQTIIFIIFFGISSIFVNNKFKYYLLLNIITYLYASVFQQIARGLGDNKSYSISSFISALMTILFNVVLLVAIKLGAEGMLIGNAIGQLVCIIYIFFKLRIYTKCYLKYFDKELLKKFLKYSIPLIPNTISWWIFNASDRIIVSYVLGVGQNGILSAAHKFSAMYITLYTFFNLSWTEMISIHINDKDISLFFEKIYNIILRLFISIGIGIIAIMPFVYDIMIDKKFFIGYYQVPIMIVGSIFNIISGLLGAIYVAKKDSKKIAKSSIIAALINVIVHLILIKQIGLFAATISTLVAYIVLTIERIYDINKRFFKVKFERKILFYVIVLFILDILCFYIRNTILSIISLLILLISCVMLNKNIVIKCFKAIKNTIL